LRKNTKCNLTWATLRLKFEKLVKKAETFQGTYYFFDVTETTNRTSRPQNFWPPSADDTRINFRNVLPRRPDIILHARDVGHFGQELWSSEAWNRVNWMSWQAMPLIGTREGFCSGQKPVSLPRLQVISGTPLA